MIAPRLNDPSLVSLGFFTAYLDPCRDVILGLRVEFVPRALIGQTETVRPSRDIIGRADGEFANLSGTPLLRHIFPHHDLCCASSGRAATAAFLDIGRQINHFLANEEAPCACLLHGDWSVALVVPLEMEEVRALDHAEPPLPLAPEHRPAVVTAQPIASPLIDISTHSAFVTRRCERAILEPPAAEKLGPEPHAEVRDLAGLDPDPLPPPLARLDIEEVEIALGRRPCMSSHATVRRLYWAFLV
jgi:hypothetical protein